MAIKISGTTVIDDSRNLLNVVGLKTVGGQTLLGSGDILAGGLSPVIVSTPTTMVKSSLFVLTVSTTLTLPADPALGDTVGISNQSGTTTAIVARNGKLIMGLDENLTVDILNAGFQLMFTGDTRGWAII